MNVVKPAQVAAVLAVTDRMGLHREAVRIPLETVPVRCRRACTGARDHRAPDPAELRDR